MSVKAREIKLKPADYSNPKVSIKIGTAENRDQPETIYIEVSFWIKNISEESSSKELRKTLSKQLQEIYDKDLTPVLTDNKFFPKFRDNLYILNIPENIDYNGKKNFVSIDVTLHTLNLNSSISYPLNNKKDTSLYEEAFRIASIISSSNFLNNNPAFEISKKK